jgi:hypothetical protein
MPFLIPFIPAIISAGTALAVGAMNNNAAGKALDAKTTANTQSIEAQNAGLDKVIGLNKPYVDAGVTAQGQVMDALGQPLRTSTTPQVQGTAATGPQFDGAGYEAANPDIKAGYQAYVNDQDTWATGGVPKGMTEAQFDQWHYENVGKGEGRTATYAPGQAATPDKPYVQDSSRARAPVLRLPPTPTRPSSRPRRATSSG